MIPVATWWRLLFNCCSSCWITLLLLTLLGMYSGDSKWWRVRVRRRPAVSRRILVV
jgi:hypothetical protein